LYVLIEIAQPDFLALSTQLGLLADSSTLFIMAAGTTFVVLLGSIDLSLQSIASLASVVVALCLPRYGAWAAVPRFALATVALAGLAWAVALGTEQLGEHIGAAATGVLQATLGNLPELLVVVFALKAGDLVVAKESAYFTLAFVNIGLVPDGGASLFVPSRIGFARAAEMALLGEPVTAPKAVVIGLINAAWPDEEFAERAGALLERLSNGPTRSYAGSKRELNHWLYSRMPEHLELEANIQGELGGSRDFREGVTAFLEKRPADFDD